jgi:aryl-alcohol dehydrogenase-like predicted oxidoreductase
MKYRRLGRTGLRVSEVGFGAWGIGGRTEGLTSYGDTDDATSLEALRRALDVGITFFDTSNVYGSGHSEALIGEAFSGCRDQVVIATKAGFTTYADAPDFTPQGIRRSVEGSLVRLKSDYVDVLQLHNPPPELLVSHPEIGETLQGMKREGLIRAHGVSVKSPDEGLAALDAFAFDSMQANLNMMDIRLIGSGLLDVAVARGVGVIARTPLCFGFLSGRVAGDACFPDGDHRNLWPRAQIERWSEGAKLLRAAVPAPVGQTQTQVALRFCLSVQGVSCVIPGILTPAEAEENAAASDAGVLPKAEMASIEDINQSHAFFVPPAR